MLIFVLRSEHSYSLTCASAWLINISWNNIAKTGARTSGRWVVTGARVLASVAMLCSARPVKLFSGVAFAASMHSQTTHATEYPSLPTSSWIWKKCKQSRRQRNVTPSIRSKFQTELRRSVTGDCVLDPFVSEEYREIGGSLSLSFARNFQTNLED